MKKLLFLLFFISPFVNAGISAPRLNATRSSGALDWVLGTGKDGNYAPNYAPISGQSALGSTGASVAGNVIGMIMGLPTSGGSALPVKLSGQITPSALAKAVVGMAVRGPVVPAIVLGLAAGALKDLLDRSSTVYDPLSPSGLSTKPIVSAPVGANLIATCGNLYNDNQVRLDCLAASYTQCQSATPNRTLVDRLVSGVTFTDVYCSAAPSVVTPSSQLTTAQALPRLGAIASSPQQVEDLLKQIAALSPDDLPDLPDWQAPSMSLPSAANNNNGSTDPSIQPQSNGTVKVFNPTETTINPDGSKRVSGTVDTFTSPSTTKITQTPVTTVDTTPVGQPTITQTVSTTPSIPTTPVSLPNATPTVVQQPTQTITFPEQKTDCDKYPNSIGCSLYGDTPTAETLTNTNVPISLTPTYSPSGSCPAPLSFSALGKTYQLSYQPVCDYALGIKFVVLALAWLSAGYLVVGGVRD